MQYANVAGVITSIDKFVQGQPTTFKIFCPNSNVSFKCRCDLFCPVRTSDTIYAYGVIISNDDFRITKPPFVQPAMDKQSILQGLIKPLKGSYKNAVKIFNIISRITQGEENFISFMTGISQAWIDTRNDDYIMPSWHQYLTQKR